MKSHLSISQVADLTHVSESTLRMWERRHGFPRAERLPGGHRRYSKRDVDNIRAVLALRMEGLHLPQAIERVLREESGRRVSITGHLRTEGASQETLAAVWPLRIALTAIVDEITLLGEDAVVITAVPPGMPVEELRDRCEAVAATARLLVVFSEQGGFCEDLVNVVHVPGAPQDTIGCHQLLIVDRSSCVIAVAVRRESSVGEKDAAEWGMQWTVDPALVRSTARLALDAAQPHAREMVAAVLEMLSGEPPSPPVTATGIVSAGVRLLRYLALSTREGGRGRRFNGSPARA